MTDGSDAIWRRSKVHACKWTSHASDIGAAKHVARVNPKCRACGKPRLPAAAHKPPDAAQNPDLSSIDSPSSAIIPASSHARAYQNAHKSEAESSELDRASFHGTLRREHMWTVDSDSTRMPRRSSRAPWQTATTTGFIPPPSCISFIIARLIPAGLALPGGLQRLPPSSNCLARPRTRFGHCMNKSATCCVLSRM